MRSVPSVSNCPDVLCCSWYRCSISSQYCDGGFGSCVYLPCWSGCSKISFISSSSVICPCSPIGSLSCLYIICCWAEVVEGGGLRFIKFFYFNTPMQLSTAAVSSFDMWFLLGNYIIKNLLMRHSFQLFSLLFRFFERIRFWLVVFFFHSFGVHTFVLYPNSLVLVCFALLFHYLERMQFGVFLCVLGCEFLRKRC